MRSPDGYPRQVDFLIRFEPAHRSIRVSAGTTLLEAARRAELPVARACGAEGVCARCGREILEGTNSIESKSERNIKERNRIDPKLRLACRVTISIDLTVTAQYW